MLSTSRYSNSRIILLHWFKLARTSAVGTSAGSRRRAHDTARGGAHKFSLPQPSWSLADLNLIQKADDAHETTTSSVLTREEVRSLLLVVSVLAVSFATWVHVLQVLNVLL